MDVNNPAEPQEVPVQLIRALTLPSSAKAGFSTSQRRCNSFSSDSTDYTTSALQSDKDKSIMAQQLILSTMPFEILESICSFLSQQDLLNVVLVCSEFRDVATQYLYMEPEFASTYRFAQFTFTVVNHRRLARYVRVLNISKFFNAREENGELAIMAGWREFKYRHHEMYTVHRPFTYLQPTYKSLEEQKAMGLPFSTQNRTHPAPSPLLSSFHQCRDVPIGAILHVLHVCKRIKRLNISRLQLASDYIIHSAAIHRPASRHIKNPDPFICIPEQSKACTTFVSDAPKSWRFMHQELIPVYSDDIIKLICRLPELEVLTARHSKWLNLRRVRTLLKDAQREGIDRKGRPVKGLRSVDLRYSGMSRSLGWPIKGRREIVEKIVTEMQETHEQTIS